MPTDTKIGWRHHVVRQQSTATIRNGDSIMTQRVVFSSDEIPAELDDRARFSLFRDLFDDCYTGSLELSRSDDQPFSMRFEFAKFGAVGISRHIGTINRIARSRRAAGNDGNDDFILAFNLGKDPWSIRTTGRSATIVPGAAALTTMAEEGEHSGGADDSRWSCLAVPRQMLLGPVGDAEDLMAIPLDTQKANVVHLRRYLDMLAEPNGFAGDAALSEHIGTTVLDLVTLCLGAHRDTMQIARERGLRAARLREVLAEIRSGFAQPAFSAANAARKLSLSPRYIQDLLSETGESFTERVLELRLQKARRMLGDPRYDHIRVGEIASMCGFHEIPYFNRCFRRRFDATPTECRADH